MPFKFNPFTGKLDYYKNAVDTVGTFASAVGSITFDTLSLKEITGGHIISTGKVRANDKFNVAGTDGITGTYNIDGTTAGTVATITITGGIITGVTTR